MNNPNTISLVVFVSLIGYCIYGMFRPEIRAFFGDLTLKHLLEKGKQRHNKTPD